MTEADMHRHCDEYIDDPSTPDCVRAFLEHARAPAHGANLPGGRPALFAKLAGVPVRIVMASRLGDVGITENLAAERGYSARVWLDELTDFSIAAPTPA
jgi:hypothetical protein